MVLKSNQLKISIIIPVYNSERYLEECIRSVLGQTYENIEIILINDGSTDTSGEICNHYSQLDRRINVIHQSNQGVSVARNAGLQCAEGDIVAFVDSDDIVQASMFEKLISRMISTNSDIVICGHTTGISLEQSVNIGYKDDTLSAYNALKLLIEDRYIRNQLWSMIFKKHLFEGIEFPVGEIYEDVRVIYRLFLRSETISVVNEALYFYRFLDNSLSHTVNINRTIELLDAFQQQEKGISEIYSELDVVCQLRQFEYCIDYIRTTCVEKNKKINSNGRIIATKAREINKKLMKNLFKRKSTLNYTQYIKLFIKYASYRLTKRVLR